MPDNGYAPVAYRGPPPPLPDRRTEYHYLNTIIEESDVSDTSPVKATLAAASTKHRHQHSQSGQHAHQHQHHAQLTLHEDRQRDVREQKIEMWLSPMSDHFPTPRGFHFLSAPILPSSPSAVSLEEDDTDIDDIDSSPNTNSASPSSPWNRHGSQSTDVSEFDDIYGASDDEAAPGKHPLRVSGGSHSRPGSFEESRRMLPQLTIPGAQRTPKAPATTDPDPKLCTSPMPPTPSAQVPMSPAIVSFMQKHHALDVPTVSAPPSLDGSMTSDQLSQLSAHPSAPPTPIIGCTDDDAANRSWSGVQLEPGALATLHSLARSDTGSTSDVNPEPDRVIEVPGYREVHPSAVDGPEQPEQPEQQDKPVEEMSETPSRPLHLITTGLFRNTVPFSPAQQRSLAGLTRLDIPSPGGFFSGLSPRTRHTWHPSSTPVDSAHPPTSGTAEQFYRLPWNDGSPPPPVPQVREPRPLHIADAETSSPPIEQVIEVAESVPTEDPVTAFRVQMTPVTARRIPPAETPPASSDTAVDQVRSVETTGSADVVEAMETTAVPSQTATHADGGSPVDNVVAVEIVGDYRTIDAMALQRMALSHLDRTEMWLVAQRAYLRGVADLTEAKDDIRSPDIEKPSEPPPVPPKDDVESPAPAAPGAISKTTLVRKKTVRFSAGIKSPPAMPRGLLRGILHQESAYYRAFTDCIVRAHHADLFINRLPRFEALQAQRLLLRDAHRNQLLGKYQLTVLPQSAKKRMSANVVRGDDILLDDPEKLRAEKEADALNQMALTTWHVAALKFLNGGRLILAPVYKRLARLSRVSSSIGPNGVGGRGRARILDLGGQATCDWAWHAALQYPNTKVYSVTTKAIRQLSNANIRGPPNHRQVAVERLTRLPFDDGQFDLVRASELYSILKFVGENGEDEWETCLNECFRVLKPGGYVEFSLLDSDIVNAGPLGNAKSVEFGFVLQTLGYDPSPTKLFLDRLRRLGFVDTRRAWLCLPLGPRPTTLARPAMVRDSVGNIVPTVELEAMVSGSTDNVAAVTGLAGSWCWERWLLRAEMEKTAGELRLADTVTAGAAMREASKSLDGIHAIVEEGRITGAAWRMLRGYARKPRDDMGTINMMLDPGMQL